MVEQGRVALELMRPLLKVERGVREVLALVERAVMGALHLRRLLRMVDESIGEQVRVRGIPFKLQVLVN